MKLLSALLLSATLLLSSAATSSANDALRNLTSSELSVGSASQRYLRNPNGNYNKHTTTDADSTEGRLLQESSPRTLVTYDKRSKDYWSTFGIMFEIEAQEDVEITSLSFYTGSTSKSLTEVWTRDGPYKDHTASSSGWDRIYSKEIELKGTNELTVVKLKTPVYIQEGETASFYIVSRGKIINVEPDVKEGKPVAQDDAIKLYAGIALDHDYWEDGCINGWKCKFSPRTFEGRIGYNVFTGTSPPRDNPANPTPTTLVTYDKRSNDRWSTHGIIFEIKAREDVEITSFSFYTVSTTKKTKTEVWTRDGPYKGYTSSSVGWEKIYSGDIDHRGPYELTVVKLKTSVYIQAGETASFYIYSPGIISVKSDVKEGKPVAQDDAIELYAGIALDYDYWEDGCINGWPCKKSPRTFEGIIGYNVFSITDPPRENPPGAGATLITYDGDTSKVYWSTFGIMFEIKAREDVTITSFSFFTGSTSKSLTEVWTRYGSYEGYTASDVGWDRIYDGKIEQGGSYELTVVKLKTPVCIPQGETASFYIVSRGKIVNVESDVKEGKPVAKDDAIELYAGIALDYDYWEDGCINGWKCMFPQRSFEGIIGYNAGCYI